MTVAEINPKTGLPFPPKETGDIECIHCGVIRKKDDAAKDHMQGCKNSPTGDHRYRHVTEE